MRVAVIGYGVEGQAAIAFWQGRGDRVAIHKLYRRSVAARGRGRPVRAIVLVGADAARIAAALEAAGVSGYEHHTETMTDVVSRAVQLAQPGDVVLLSPPVPASASSATTPTEASSSPPRSTP